MSSSSMPAAALADNGHAAPAPAPAPYSFSVQAQAEPGVMPRVLELFAKRGLVPHKWHSTASAAALAIDVQVGGIGRDLADYIARCMRQITGVETVLTAELRSAA
jgi:acetolactate synthase regulatory subunit